MTNHIHTKIAIAMALLLSFLGMGKTMAQDVAVKTNGLYWLATTPNAGVEFATSDKCTLELSGAYNPWTFHDDKKMKFWLFQPEFKYWFCEKFEGHFVGMHQGGYPRMSPLEDKRCGQG